MKPGAASIIAISDFFRSGREIGLRAGEIALRGAEEPPGLFYIEDGYVKVYSIGTDGSEHLHVIYQPGEMFPLLWALRGVRRNVFYECISPVRLGCRSKPDFLEFISRDTASANAVLELVVSQFYVYTERINNLEVSGAGDRVVHRLLFLCSRFGRQLGESVMITAPVTHQHIASSINLARETVSRELQKLEARGLLRYQDHRLVVVDYKRLAEASGEPNGPDNWGLMNRFEN